MIPHTLAQTFTFQNEKYGSEERIASLSCLEENPSVRTFPQFYLET